MIRLSRIGKKKQPFYRLVVSEKARDMYGRALEIIGSYNPRTKAIEVSQERLDHWLSLGAQASDTVYNLLIEKGFMKGKKVPVTHISKKKRAASKEREKKAGEEKAALAKAEEKAVADANAQSQPVTKTAEPEQPETTEEKTTA